MIGRCFTCETDVDRDRQCDARGEPIVTDSFPGSTDPTQEVVYCWRCAITLWPDLEQVRWH